MSITGVIISDREMGKENILSIDYSTLLPLTTNSVFFFCYWRPKGASMRLPTAR